MHQVHDNSKTPERLVLICAKCKKIRDGKGSWIRLEGEIESYTDALFSHGLCPECMDDLYGNEEWYKRK